MNSPISWGMSTEGGGIRMHLLGINHVPVVDVGNVVSETYYFVARVVWENQI
jgi:hypothetical protein